VVLGARRVPSVREPSLNTSASAPDKLFRCAAGFFETKLSHHSDTGNLTDRMHLVTLWSEWQFLSAKSSVLRD